MCKFNKKFVIEEPSKRSKTIIIPDKKYALKIGGTDGSCEHFLVELSKYKLIPKIHFLGKLFILMDFIEGFTLNDFRNYIFDKETEINALKIMDYVYDEQSRIEKMIKQIAKYSSFAQYRIDFSGLNTLVTKDPTNPAHYKVYIIDVCN